MDVNAIQVAVRVRPLTPYEATRIPEEGSIPEPFFGDGGLAGGSANSGVPQSPRGAEGGYSGRAAGGVWREVVDVVDHRTLIFDKPDTNVPRAFINAAKAPPGGRKYRDQRYAFDRVFSKESSQDEVFEGTALPVLGGLFDGYNATVFAYGATGCGKTHTVSGTIEDPGIIYRTMQHLFTKIREDNDTWQTVVTVSFLEIYNELIRDLLSEDFPVSPRGGLSLREDEKNKITVAGLSQKQPQSAEEVLEYVLLGNSRRSSSPTHANAQSSRSHAVLQVNISRRPIGGDVVDVSAGTLSTNVTSATLSIIDLAGSERASATQNMGNRMKEGANINKSLLALGNCINALCEAAAKGSRSPHIPYRDSKLTRLLKFSLGGNCRTVMIVCVSPCSVHLEDTGNTLKYANRAKNIVTKVSRNMNGVERNITQYLQAIADKDATIKVLEAKLAERSGALSSAQLRKQSEAKAEMAQVKLEMQSKMKSFQGATGEEASCRVSQDAADLRIQALRKRIDIVNAGPDASSPIPLAERARLSSLLQREEDTYVNNPEVQAKLNNASKQSSFRSAYLRSMQARRFDRMEEDETESIRLEAKLHATRADLASAEGREQAYRSVLAVQAETTVNILSALVRLVEAGKLGGRSDEPDRTDLEMLSRSVVSSEAVLKALVGSASRMAPVSQRRQSTTTGDRFSVGAGQPRPPRPRASIGPSMVAPNKRMSVAGNVPSYPASAPAINLPKPSPAIRKLHLSDGPKRLAGSPKKRPTAHSLLKVGAAQNQPKKTLRWRDEAGEGDIDDVRPDSGPATSSSSGEDSFTLPRTPEVEEEPGWVDDMDEQTTSRTVVPVKPMQAAPVEVPEWKKNRLMVGRSLNRLGSLGEESDVASSPESVGPARPSRIAGSSAPIRPMKSSPALMSRTLQPSFTHSNTSVGISAPPSRPARPLGKPFSLFPSATAAIKSPTPTNNTPPQLQRPSHNPFASVSRPSTLNSSSAMGTQPSLTAGLPSLPTSRRLSTIGPMRSERKRSRASMLPSLNEDDMMSSMTFGMSQQKLAGSAGLSSILGGSSNLPSPLESPSKRSPKKTSRRSSIKPPRPSLLSGGRPAMTIPPNPSSYSSSYTPTAPVSLRAAAPTLSSQNKAVVPGASLRRMASVPGLPHMTDHGTGRCSPTMQTTNATSNGASMRQLPQVPKTIWK